MSIVTQSFSISSRSGGTVRGDIRYASSAKNAPVVIFCHGFKGFKDWGPFPYWGTLLAENGFVSIHFNFAFNGVGADDPTSFTEPDLFAQNTFLRELDDLGAVISSICTRQLGAIPADTTRIGLMGHSRGGGTAILMASENARVKCLVTWSAVADFVSRFSAKQISDFSSQGFTEIRNARTGQMMRLDRMLYDEAIAFAEQLDIGAAAENIDIPWLIIHADDDEAVPVLDAKTLKKRAPSAHLERLSGGHTFGGKHPFSGEPPASLEAVFSHTLQFFKANL